MWTNFFLILESEEMKIENRRVKIRAKREAG
jgi:hypothetical protein